MKRVVLLFLCLAFCASLAFAGDDVGFIEYSVYVRNESLTHTDYIMPITTVRPGVDKITGYDCRTLAPAGAGTETWISIFDDTDSLMSGECFAEAEADGKESIHDWWPNGKKIVKGIAFRMGALTEGIIRFRRN